MRAEVKSQISRMIDINTPIIYIQDYDFWRIDEIIQEEAEEAGAEEIVEWNAMAGSTNFKSKKAKRDTPESLEDFLLNFYNDEETDEDHEKFLVLKNIHTFLDEQTYPNYQQLVTTMQLIAQRRLYQTDNEGKGEARFNTTIFIVSPIIRIPKEIEKYVSILDLGFPSDEEINELIDRHTEVNKFKGISDSDREKLLPSLRGMTLFEIDRMLDVAMSSNGTLSADDSGMILKQKKAMVKKAGLLELVDSPETIDSIGGLENLKEYLLNKAKIISNSTEAQKHGVSIPKGVFIVGMPGCGKSLCAKASAAIFNAPLLKMDMGTMMGKYVGESEGNLRKAIQIAEAAAPCVLWIDEIEKAFSGVNGDGNNDVLMRMFGYFLTWMQDKQSCVYVIATANNAEKLPPELKRKGRFDEIFCVNLPNEEERKAIFRISLDKGTRKNCKRNFDKVSDALIKATNRYNGADIDAIVNEAIERNYLENLGKPAEEQKPLTEQMIEAVRKETKSISETAKNQIENLEKLFGDKNSTFKNASK